MLDQAHAWIFNACCAATAAGCAIYVAARDARWRRTGISRQLEDRIALAQKTADDWHQSSPARELKAEVDRQGKVLDAHDGCLAVVASRTDIARVEGTVNATQQLAKAARDGVDRIEGMLIKRALDGDRR